MSRAAVTVSEAELEKPRRQLGRHSGTRASRPRATRWLSVTPRPRSGWAGLSGAGGLVSRPRSSRRSGPSVSPASSPAIQGRTWRRCLTLTGWSCTCLERALVAGRAWRPRRSVGPPDRQVFDVPVRRLEVTEHRAERRRCGCGAVTKAVFPSAASAPAAYGPALRAGAVYLMHAQHVPVARAAELMATACGAPVSTGWPCRRGRHGPGPPGRLRRGPPGPTAQRSCPARR